MQDEGRSQHQAPNAGTCSSVGAEECPAMGRSPPEVADEGRPRCVERPCPAEGVAGRSGRWGGHQGRHGLRVQLGHTLLQETSDHRLPLRTVSSLRTTTESEKNDVRNRSPHPGCRPSAHQALSRARQSTARRGKWGDRCVRPRAAQRRRGDARSPRERVSGRGVQRPSDPSWCGRRLGTGELAARSWRG